MRNKWRYSAVVVMGLALLTQFTNCDVYQKGPETDQGSQSCPGGPDCPPVVTGDPAALYISASTSVNMSSSELFKALDGNCNAGGFMQAQISWKVWDNGAYTAQCGQPVNGSPTSCAVCQPDNTFHVDVVFPFPGPSANTSIVLEIRGWDGTKFVAGTSQTSQAAVQVKLP